MLFPGDIFLKIFEFVCYIALVILIAAGLGYGFLYLMGECQHFLAEASTCSSGFYSKIAEFTYTVILGTLFSFFPLILALGGIFWILRNIHHKKTTQLRAEGRDAEVIKLRVFLGRIFVKFGFFVLAVRLFVKLFT